MWKLPATGCGRLLGGGPGGAVLVFLVRDRYEASARLWRAEHLAPADVRACRAAQCGAAGGHAGRSRLISRPTVEKLIRAADLTWVPLTTRAEQEALIDEVMKSIQMHMAAVTTSIPCLTAMTRPSAPSVWCRPLMTILVGHPAWVLRTDSDAARRFWTSRSRPTRPS